VQEGSGFCPKTDAPLDAAYLPPGETSVVEAPCDFVYLGFVGAYSDRAWSRDKCKNFSIVIIMNGM